MQQYFKWFISNTLHSTDEDVETLLKETEVYDLVVYNDDVNTFEFVIQTLVEICRHTLEQAEQCTILIHYKGRCTVKIGSYEELLPMRAAIVDRGINAEIH